MHIVKNQLVLKILSSTHCSVYLQIENTVDGVHDTFAVDFGVHVPVVHSHQSTKVHCTTRV